MKQSEYVYLINEGTERAYTKLYTELSRYLKSVLYNKYKSHNEDIISETLLSISRNIHTYDPSIASFKTWVIKILINEFNANYRYKTYPKRDHRRELSLSSNDDTENKNIEVEDPDTDILQDIYDKEFDVKSILKKHIIKKEYIELYQFFYTNKKMTEIAKDLDMNVNTLKSRIAKQKKSCIKSLKYLRNVDF